MSLQNLLTSQYEGVSSEELVLCTDREIPRYNISFKSRKKEAITT